MGYPLELQPLVIEDDIKSRDYYDEVFAGLAREGHLVVKPEYAFCHTDGVTALDSDRIYHLVILDLRLPRCPDEPPAEHVDFGLDLFQRCLDRNNYPIPALLVISAHLDRTHQSDLQARAVAGFAYGHVLLKGTNLNLEADIKTAVSRAVDYCKLGLHVRDGGIVPFPTISPRDEDLLRRAVLAEGCCTGLDLRWWAAEYSPPFSADAVSGGWTKTLMGSFLLGKGMGRSRATFFKLAPNAGADTVVAEARLLQHKLSHIKVFTPVSTGDRSLLITQKVGDGDGPPVSLADYLGRPSSEVGPQLPAIVREVATQLQRLGNSTPDQRPVHDLLWPHHDAERLTAQWSRWGGPQLVEQLGSAYDAVAMFSLLRRRRFLLRVGIQSALHGDLNPTNVALDTSNGHVRGYIFDAAGVSAGVNIRDLAMLEVTSQLHLPVGTEEPVVAGLAPLYGTRGLEVLEPPPEVRSDRVRNNWSMISELRRAASLYPDAPGVVYAILVFDQALIQLGGLAFAVSRNKIRDPEQAAQLAAHAANWIEMICPGFCAAEKASASNGSPVE